MEQVIFGGDYDILHDTNTEYNTLGGAGNFWRATDAGSHQLISTDGVIKNLRVKLNDSPGEGTHYDFTLMLNGNPTALTLEIADAATSGSNTVNEITVTGGDRVSIECNPDSTPTARYASWTTVFEGANANESLILGASPPGALNQAAITYAQVMGASAPSATESLYRQVCPTAGTIKNLYVWLAADPGDIGVDAYRFTLRVGGVSKTLTVTITADATTGNDTSNEVAVVAGDVLTMMIEPLETPGVTPEFAWSMTFVADTDGESIVIGGSYQDLDDTDTEYNRLTGNVATAWTATEAQRYMLGQECTLKKLYVLLSDSPGAGNKYDFTIRIAGASSNVVATVDGENTTGNSAELEDTVSNDEYVGLEVNPDSTPTVRDAYWGLVSYRAPPVGLENKSANMAAKMVAAGLI